VAYGDTVTVTFFNGSNLPFVTGGVEPGEGTSGEAVALPGMTIAHDLISHSLGGDFHTGTLLDDQGPQFALTSGARAFSGQVTISPASIAAPFALGANAQGQLVTGLNADLLDGLHFSDLENAFVSQNTLVIAGDGLTGGGALSGNVTLSVLSVNSALDVSFEGVEVVLAVPSGLQISSGLMIADSLAGNGLTIASKVLNVGAGTLISVGADTVGLANGSAQYQVPVTGANPYTPAYTALSSFAGGGLLFSGGVFVVGAGSGITVNADDVALNWGTPTITTIQPDDAASYGSSANPARSDHRHAIATAAPAANSVNLAASTEGIGTSFARADHTHQLDQSIAPTWTGQHLFQNNIVARHIRPEATDTYDLGTSVYWWNQSFISQINAVIFAEQTIQLLGGWFIVPKDAGKLPAVSSAQTQIDFGKAMTVGHFILIKAHDTSGAIKTEYMQIGTLVSGTTYNVTRDLAAANSPDPTWADGTPYMLLGASGDGRIELNAYDTPRISLVNQGATYNAQSELVRIGDLNGNWGYGTQTFGVAIGARATSTVNLTVEATNGFRIFNNATQLAQWDASGNILIGQAIAGQSNLYLSAGMVQIRNNTTVLGQWDASGNILIGQAAASQSNVYITSGAVQWRTNTTVNAELTSAGVLLLGDDAGGEYISIDSTNGVRLYGNSTLLGQWTAAGGIVIGEVANSKSRIEIASGAISLINRNGSGVDSTKVSITAGGTATFVGDGNGVTNINGGNIQTGTVTATQIAASTITADKLNVTQLSAISANLGTITAGTITSGTIRTAASGARIEMNSSQIFGTNGTTTQWYANASDGKLYAGGGSVVLSANGIDIGTHVNNNPSSNRRYSMGADAYIFSYYDNGAVANYLYTRVQYTQTGQTLNFWMWAGMGGKGAGVDGNFSAASLNVGTSGAAAGEIRTSGYIYAGSYINTPAGVTTGAASHLAVQTNSDSWIRWQTPAQFKTNHRLGTLLNFINMSTLGWNIAANTNVCMASIDAAYTLKNFAILTQVVTTNNGSNYWTINVRRYSDTAVIFSLNTSGNTAGISRLLSTTRSDAISTSDLALYVEVVKVGSPGNINIGGPAAYVE
jgi:hypothetical protein